jgi:branched-chain amino acid aminotransferase
VQPAASLASLDGAIAPAAETRIPVTDEGLLRGDGAFEVIRLYAGRPFALDEHLERLAGSAGGIRLEIDLTALRREIDALLAEVEGTEGLLRLVVTRGGRRIAIVEPLPDHPATARVKTIPFSPTRVLDGIKATSYAANMLAGRLAHEDGFDEALFVTPHGRVLEGPMWTFFYVVRGELLTPPLEDRILESITRDRVIAETGAREAVCTLDDVRAAEEAFIASSVREVMPIAAVDDIVLPAAPGPVTQDARERLARRIERELGAPA